MLSAVSGEHHHRPRAPLDLSGGARWVLGGSSVLLAALISVGLVALARSSPGAGPRTRSSAIALSLSTTRASLRRAGLRTELIVSGMPEPPVGEVYELWLNRASTAPQPTDVLFTVTREGNGAVDVPGSLRGVREVTVTSEPLGGSSSPTTAPLLRLLVTAPD
ncbi:MAG: anti-sigma factor [Solirubrobacteraceae bacterium]